MNCGSSHESSSRIEEPSIIEAWWPRAWCIFDRAIDGIQKSSLAIG